MEEHSGISNKGSFTPFRSRKEKGEGSYRNPVERCGHFRKATPLELWLYEEDHSRWETHCKQAGGLGRGFSLFSCPLIS